MSLWCGVPRYVFCSPRKGAQALSYILPGVLSALLAAGPRVTIVSNGCWQTLEALEVHFTFTFPPLDQGTLSSVTDKSLH